jgi:hypothetical protein
VRIEVGTDGWGSGLMPGNFSTSTHAAHWLFSEVQVAGMREQANAEYKRGAAQVRGTPACMHPQNSPEAFAEYFGQWKRSTT